MSDLGVKKDFPIFTTHPQLVFLDNAATTQKPAAVTGAEKEFYETTYANIHRATYDIAAQATDLFEGTRQQVAQFINAASSNEILFTRNASEALNLAAYIEGQKLQAGDELLVSVAGHHSNILPWMRLVKAKGAKIVWIELTPEGRLDVEGLLKHISARTKVVAFEHVSNVMGYVSPVKEITTAAQAVGARVVVDVAQSSCRMPVDAQDLGADYMAFSGHKMYGPTGSGWLYAKEELLAEAEPMLSGGGTIKKVTRDTIVWADVPFRFEAGTPDIASVISLSAGLTYLSAIGMDNVWTHDQAVMEYAMEKLRALPGLRLYGPHDIANRAAIFSFLVEVHGKLGHSHDVADICNQRGVAVRGGHHCAQILMQALGVEDVNRASFGIYNNEGDVDRLVEALAEVQRIFGKS